METFVAVSNVIDEINRLSMILGDDIVGLKSMRGTEAESVAPEGIDAEIEAKSTLAKSLAAARTELNAHGERMLRYCGSALELKGKPDVRFMPSVASSLSRAAREGTGA